MLRSCANLIDRVVLVTTWQTVRLVLALALGCVWPSVPNRAPAQLVDSLDAYPPRFFLDASDCEAELTSHENSATAGRDGGGCEVVTLTAGHGSEAVLIYPIEPVQPIDDLNASVSIMSAKEGPAIGLRVRFPYLRDPQTRRSADVVIYGASYSTPGEFSAIGVGLIRKSLQLKKVALRRQYGAQCDLSGAYVDGVAINAYCGPGKSSIHLDDLRVDGLIPVGESLVTADSTSKNAAFSIPAGSADAMNSFKLDQFSASAIDPVNSQLDLDAFPVGRVTKIVQYNGEPLAWIRTLGFDAVLLSQHVNSAILAEAMRARVKIYAPPPTSPDPSIEAMLEPVAGWIAGQGQALDRRHLASTQNVISSIRDLPSRWRRPVLIAPSDGWRQYASIADAVISDLPPRIRGVSGKEEIEQTETRRRWMNQRAQFAIGLSSTPPQAMLRQTQGIASELGAPMPSYFQWHGMWMQVMRSLRSQPSAILYRSTRSLASGTPLDQTRAMSMSYVNRMIAMLEPWLVTGRTVGEMDTAGGSYRCDRMASENADVLVLTSTARRDTEVLAGDGQTIRIDLAPDDASKTIWRMTQFTAERMTSTTTSRGSSIEIVSPDFAEVIVLSHDPTIGARLAEQAQRFGRQASLDRWQLASETVKQARSGWNQAIASRVSGVSQPPNLLSVAQRTMDQAEPTYRAGDLSNILRMARRADAWAIRSQWQLSELLMPDWPNPTSSPPMDVGSHEVQSLWRPLMDDDGWSQNWLTTGTLDSPELIGPGRWTFGQRMTDVARSEISLVNRNTYAGTGALRATVTPLRSGKLGGGYAGTVVQISSPSVKVKPQASVRIDVMLRTIGFGDAHQGVLVYDSLGGQPMGKLVRATTDWTKVTLYRHTNRESDINVMFELIGSGETMIDEVSIRTWEPESITRSLIRPIN